MDFRQVELATLEYLKEEPFNPYRIEAEYLLERARAGDASSLEELESRMIGQLRFGTAGIRAKMQAGYLRLNHVSICRITQGLGDYMLDQDLAKRGVVVGFDGRLNSQAFVETVVSVLSLKGIPVWCFESPTPTPLCPWAVLQLGAGLGVMITASHNPKEDNGYKVYGANGAQIESWMQQEIEKGIQKSQSYFDIQTKLKKAQLDTQKSLKKDVPKDVIESYFKNIKRQAFHPLKTQFHEPIVYTALHGVGHAFVDRALCEAGFLNVISVAEQKEPDGHFPTLDFPNPEEDGVLDLAIETAKRHKAKLILANDPDADRLACVVEENGGYRVLTGNEIGTLLGYDVVRFSKIKNPLLITTYVSSRQLSFIAKKEGIAYADTQTGFTHIAQEALRGQERGETFVFGYEEALGYCIGNSGPVDKDGIVAATRLAELYYDLQAKGSSFCELLDQIAYEYGVCESLQWSFRFQSLRWQDSIQSFMDQMSQLQSFKAFPEKPLHLLINEPRLKMAEIPRLLRWIIRPSGTEPKMKFYLEAYGNASSIKDVKTQRQRLKSLLIQVQKEIQLLCEVNTTV